MITLIGVSHQSAPVSLREKMAYQEQELATGLKDLTARNKIAEACILSTCNRVEILAWCEGGMGIDCVRSYLQDAGRITSEELDRYSYQYHGADAVRHIFRVASGLESMVLGEPQILGQLKAAYAAARQAGTVGAILDRLLRNALSGAKKIRTETGISRHPVSIASAAVELARKIFGALDGCSALLLGAGQMSELVATRLRAHGVERIIVASRTYTRAADLAGKFEGTACNWDSAESWLDSVDIVVSGTAAPGIVLKEETVRKAIRARRNRPLFLIDIAVPRDVDPAVNRLDNVYLFDVDNLEGVVEESLHERRKSAEEAKHRIEHEVEVFERWMESLKVAPALVRLREKLHGVGAMEYTRFRKKLGPLTSEQELQVHNLLRSVIQKILHSPLQYLKGSAERGDAMDAVARYQEIFDIPIDEDSGRNGAGNQSGPTHMVEGGKESRS